MTRTRTFDWQTPVTGRYYYGGAWYVKTKSQGEWGKCEDEVGHWDHPNDLRIRRYDHAHPTLDGYYYSPPGVLNRAFEHHPVDRLPTPADPSAFWGKPDLNAAALELFSRTNPGSPYVSVPQVIAELKDLPDLVRSWGRKVLQWIARGWISWQFAIKPMVSDIRKLLNFQAAVAKRFRYLKQLRDSGSVKRRVQMGYDVDEVTTASTQYLQSIVATVTAKKKTLYTALSWATCQWRLNPFEYDFNMSTDRDLWDRAVDLCSGVTTYEGLQVFWELIPWSWFVDWFWDVGTFIRANNNSVPAHPEWPCLMRTSTARNIYSDYSMPAWVSMNGEYTEFQVVKERWVLPTVPAPSVNFPLIDERKWSILLALRFLNGSWFGSRRVPLFTSTPFGRRWSFQT